MRDIANVITVIMRMDKKVVITKEQFSQYRDTLKRCPEGTLDALRCYRETGSLEGLSKFLIGCIKRHTEEEYHHLIEGNDPKVSFIDDLSIDSMTMIEIVMMVEECLEIKIDNQDLIKIRSMGDLNTYLANSHKAL